MSTVLIVLGVLVYLVGMVCAIVILVSAFKESVAQGFLTLCVPFYVFYYAFARFKSEKKGLVIAGWLGGGILGAILFFAGGAMTAKVVIDSQGGLDSMMQKTQEAERQQQENQ